MVGRYSILGRDQDLSEEILDEIEGKALVILDHPDRFATPALTAARHALDNVRRRRGGSDRNGG